MLELAPNASARLDALNNDTKLTQVTLTDAGPIGMNINVVTLFEAKLANKFGRETDGKVWGVIGGSLVSGREGCSRGRSRVLGQYNFREL